MGLFERYLTLWVGLGIVGGGIHTADEYAEVDSIAPRIYLLAPVGYFVLGFDTTVLQMNVVGADLLGLSRGKPEQTSFRQFIAPRFHEDFVAPDPHGPAIDGGDPFKKDVEASLAAHGISVSWVEDWDAYHRNLGEVHCGTNARRRPWPDLHWWEHRPDGGFDI